MITSLKLAVVRLLSRILNSNVLTYCLRRRRMSLHRQHQHNIDTRSSPPHRPHFFVLCHRCRMPACANWRWSARRLYSHLRTCRGEKVGGGKYWRRIWDENMQIIWRRCYQSLIGWEGEKGRNVCMLCPIIDGRFLRNNDVLGIHDRILSWSKSRVKERLNLQYIQSCKIIANTFSEQRTRVNNLVLVRRNFF